MKLILYSKPDCCLCQGLHEKLQEVLKLDRIQFELEVREITSNLNWFDKYEYEVPVLCLWNEKLDPPQEQELPRLSPRSPVAKLEQLLQRYSD